MVAAMGAVHALTVVDSNVLTVSLTIRNSLMEMQGMTIRVQRPVKMRLHAGGQQGPATPSWSATTAACSLTVQSVLAPAMAPLMGSAPMHLQVIPAPMVYVRGAPTTTSSIWVAVIKQQRCLVASCAPKQQQLVSVLLPMPMIGTS
eukprot:XP_001703841.1 Hypothetical protein GL50803_125105 [Giardia lamblia ATCC 50803]